MQGRAKAPMGSWFQGRPASSQAVLILSSLLVVVSSLIILPL